jgi:hypothetical protein
MAMANNGDGMDDVQDMLNDQLIRLTMADELDDVSQYQIEEAALVELESVDGSAIARLVDADLELIKPFDRSTLHARLLHALDSRYRGMAGKLYVAGDSAMVYDANRQQAKWVYLRGE